MTRGTVWTDQVGGAAGAVEGEHDTIVIGGGLTGLTTALLLARAGQRVLVLEADRLGGVSTSRSSAKVSVLQGTRLATLARRHGAETVAAYVGAGLEGQSWLRAFCESHDVPHQQQTAYTYATTEDGRQLLDQEYRQAARAGLRVRRTEDLDLPFSTAGAVALDDQFQVDPTALTAALVREAEGAGVSLAAGARVRHVRGRGPFRVGTDVGEASAASVVVATNYPLTDRLGHFAWFTAHRSYVVALEGEAPAGMYLSAETPSRSLRGAPVGGRSHLLVGGQGHPTGRVPDPEHHLEQLRAWAHRHFGGRAEVAAWSAQDYATADGLPWVGPLAPGMPRLVAAGGYDKWGFTTAAAAALRLSAGLLEDGDPTLSGPLTSWRPRVTGLPAAARNGALTGVELGGGLLRVVREGPRDTSMICTHLGGIVRRNDAEDSWDCPLHGSRFGPDGAVLEGPARCGLRGHPDAAARDSWRA